MLACKVPHDRLGDDLIAPQYINDVPGNFRPCAVAVFRGIGAVGVLACGATTRSAGCDSIASQYINDELETFVPAPLPFLHYSLEPNRHGGAGVSLLVHQRL